MTVERRYVIKKPRGRGGHSPHWAAEPKKIIIYLGELKTNEILRDNIQI
jgi:hypothetical protein